MDTDSKIYKAEHPAPSTISFPGTSSSQAPTKSRTKSQSFPTFHFKQINFSKMRFTVLTTTLLALAQYACAVPVEAGKADALDVTLTQISDTRIKAVVKNTGKEDVTFVHLNFFRDSAPVKKVAVYKDSECARPVSDSRNLEMIINRQD